MKSADETIAAATPGPTPPSHEATTTGTKKKNASSVCATSVRNGRRIPAATTEPTVAIT